VNRHLLRSVDPRVSRCLAVIAIACAAAGCVEIDGGAVELAWTLRDFVVKSSVNPARMLRLPAKGHLGVGADADVTVVDLAAGRADWSLARGRIVLADGKVSGRGGMLLVSPAGESVARSARVSHEVIHREGWR